MKIVADENISNVKEFFAGFGEVQLMPGRAINTDAVAEADVLLVRSVTKVDKALLAGSRVKFVGTCTIGMDHIDHHYLQNQGIGFASAPGCNANAVVDYVLCALATVALEQGICLATKTLGIVGLGNVGSRLKIRAEALGLTCVCCDPLLQRQGQEGLVPLAELLAKADIISLHTPLTLDGEDATYHLLNTKNLAQIRHNAILINSARGEVLDNKALSQLLQEREDIRAVLDVWESEPTIAPDLLKQVYIATPHIAGYSLEGKLQGTAMVCRGACDFFGYPQQEFIDLFPPKKEVLFVAGQDESWEEIVYRVMLACYDIGRDSAALKSLTQFSPEQIGIEFDRLRKEYPLRREFKQTKIISSAIPPELRLKLEVLGLQ